MKKNMGKLDIVLRLAVVIVIAVLYFTGNISGTAAIILGIIAVIFLVTALVGYCPLYGVCGIKTNKNTKTS